MSFMLQMVHIIIVNTTKKGTWCYKAHAIHDPGLNTDIL
jgi:hypothetical protein